ncbi:MAG TPA: MbnP family copper-binding protein [Woeseiaceae bacterium]|nr:MbnP family copper-binding protein [Woeseiaceae bacterium]
MRRLIALVALLLLGSCSRWDLGVEVPFVATWKGQPLSCESAGPALTDLRFYVDDPQLIDLEGNAHHLRYATEFEWQNDVVALIDLENGEGTCENGTDVFFDRLIGVTRAGSYRGLRFTVGVPFRLNHANPLTATTPLGDAAMHWHWRSGYKFLRAGVQSTDDGFWIHVGSAGCDGTVGHITDCRFPNRVEVFLPDFVPGESVVVVELAELLAGTNLDDGEVTNCSSGPAEDACVAPFSALGIDFTTGKPTGAQRVFAVR